MSLESLLAAQGHILPPTAPARTNRKNDGREFQKEIEQTAGVYNSRRVATLKKVDTPVRIIWPPNRFTGKPEQRIIQLPNPHLDYVGCWTARGARMLAIEAKSTSVHLLAFNREDGGFKATQWAAMKSWRWSGAACALVWKFNDRVMLWTPEMLMKEQAAGAKSLKHENGVPVSVGLGSLRWDFLGTLERKLWATP